MKYVFLDTNIFIHFSDFEQLDWQTIIDTKKDIVITLAPIVIDELDKHKYNKNPKISKRVKKILPKIEKYIDNPELCKYDFKYIFSRPLEITFTENKLDRNEQDDCLLATIIEFSKTLANSESLVYITNDVGPRLKAKTLNIPTLKLTDDCLLPNELDEAEIKNIKLQNELNDLKSKAPILSLSFANESNLMKYKRNHIEYSKKDFIENEMKKARIDNPYMVYRDPTQGQNKNSSITFLHSTAFSLSETQIIEYNKQLDIYFKEHEKYAEKLFEAFEFTSNTIEIELVLDNKGTSPALDIDIEIHFPDGFELFQEKDISKISKKASLPYKPKHRYDFNFNLDPIGISSIQTNRNVDLSSFNQPKIKKTNSYLVSYPVQSLKHNQSFELEKLYAKFKNIKEAKGFTLDYKLIVSNITKVITGQLHISFEE